MLRDLGSETVVSAGPATAPGQAAPCIAVVIPCYRAVGTLAAVLRALPPVVARAYVVDDGCPDDSWRAADPAHTHAALTVLRNPGNLGVGGAMKRGYRAALADGATVIVKLDADGQMDPALIPRLVQPVLAGRADYAKGNRFARAMRMPAAATGRMPGLRRIGNNLVSFVHKGVTGCWHVHDPANGYTAVHARALAAIDLDAVADCYLFEVDMLFQLGLAGAVVEDVPLPARYEGAGSSLSLRTYARRFPPFALRRFGQRIAARYFIEDFNVASLEMLVAALLLPAGIAIGLWHWVTAVSSGVPTTPGTVMFAALPIIIGTQLLLSAVSFDIAQRPRVPLSSRAAEG